MPAPVFEALHIPGVLTVKPPTAPAVSLVFDSPHSGLDLPADFHPAVSPEMVRMASDTYVDELFSIAPSIGAPLLLAHFPRSFLDANRSLKDVDPDMIKGTWPQPLRDSPTVKRGMGLAWRYAWEDTLMHDRLLTVAEMEARIDTYWRPYHTAIRKLLDATHAGFGVVYHVNCHSMPAIGHKLSPDPAGTVRPDIVVGDFDGIAAEKGFVDMIVETLKSFGLSVAVNKPFRGAELVSAYSDPKKGRHSVQIEVNRKLYMDETTRARTVDFPVLKGYLDDLGVVIRDYVTDHTPKTEAAAVQGEAE